MIGIIAALALMLVGFVSYIYFFIPEDDSIAVKVEGNLSTVKLPTGYKFVKLSNGRHAEYIKEGVKRAGGMAYDSSDLTITPSDSITGNMLQLPESLVKYLTVSTDADTLCIKLSATKEQIRQDFNKEVFVDLQADFHLNLLPEVQDINMKNTSCHVSLQDLQTDSFSINTQGVVDVDNCHIKNFTPFVDNVLLNSGSIENLYLDMDECYGWQVSDDFNIYREVITSAISNSDIVKIKHCKILEWEPKKEDTSLYLDLRRKAKIIFE